MAAHSSKPSDRNQRWKYDIFLSFRGTDTRNNFTDHLFEALKKRGFIIFKDDEKLPRGEVISEELLKAIEESFISVVILSENFASSTWCLNELLKILECRKLFDRTVFPVFYGVDPSTIRHQTGRFKEAFEKHEGRFRDDPEKVQGWRNALKEVADISGEDSRNWRETELIRRIVEAVWKKLKPELSTFNNGFVGIDSKMADMYSLLRMELDDVRFIGIWGMGGIGKTALASVVFNQICSVFDNCCFLANIREEFGERGHGLLDLQRKLLSALEIRDMKIDNAGQGKDIIRCLLCNRKVLLVLDDVSSVRQLQGLAENEWFGPGSRIIVTTRDSHILTSHGISSIYNIRILNKDESFQLFCEKAFKSNKPLKPNFLKLSNEVVQFAGSLPLALEVIGSHLYGRDISIWQDALNMLKKDPQFNIWKTLRISYDALLDMEKAIFLDIACFFKGWQKDHLTQILEKCGFHARYGIEALIEKSLVTLDRNGHLGMHDLLEEMGRNIVYQECPSDACKRSRLWSLEDIDKVFRNNKGTESIQAVALNLSRPHEAHWDTQVFSKTSNLRLLIASGGLCLPLGLKCLPSGLKVLIWRDYPLKSLPDEPLDELVYIDLPDSKINQLCIDSQSFSKLVSLNLVRSKDLIKTPNFAGIPNLKTLDLRCCINLVEVDPSISLHRKLVEVNLKGCINLQKLPEKLEMSSLEILHLDDCSNVGKVPEFGDNMVALLQLTLDGTAIVELPPSLGSLSGLLTLSLNRCRNLICLPNSFGKLKSLTDLSIMGCSQISKLPYNLAENEALQYLNALETAIRELPSSIVHLKSLNCLYVQVLPALPPSFSSLWSLISLSLSYCKIRDGAFPQNLECLSSLEELDLFASNVERLPCLSGLLKLRNVHLDLCQNLLSLPLLPTNMEYLTAMWCHNLKEISFHPHTSSLLVPNDFEEDVLATITSKCKNEDFQSSNNKEQFKGKDITTSDVREPGVESFVESTFLSFCSNIRQLKLRGCSLSDEGIPQNLGFFSALEFLDLGGNDFVNLPSDWISKLFKLRTLLLANCQSLQSLPNLPPNLEYVCLANCQSLKSLPNLPPKLKDLILDYCRSLESLPKLPPNAAYVTALHCDSMKPPPDQYQQQILGLLAASMELKFYKSYMTMESPLEFGDVFCVPGSEIPQWFDNQNCCVPNKPFLEDFDAISITVDIPDICFKSDCWGIAACFVIQNRVRIDIIGRNSQNIKSLEGPHLLIVHYCPHNRQFDQSKSQLTIDFMPPFWMKATCKCKIKKWGYRVFSKEDAQSWRKKMTSQCSIEELQSSNDDENQLDGKDATSYDVEANQPAAKRRKLT